MAWRIDRRMVRLLPLLAAALLSACVSGPSGDRRVATASPPPRQAVPDMSYRQCVARLDASAVRFAALPDREMGGGCAVINAVKLMDFGVPATNLGAMTCPLAANFAAWARHGVGPAARLVLGSEVVRIETFGTYACRNIIGAGSGRLSEHATGNAVDVAAFVLADGRRVSVQNDWAVDGPEARFLRIVRASACKRFRTVLSPDYNAAHRDHLHFDMGGRGGYCR